MFAKETYDLVREKRFGAWALAYGAFWTFILVVMTIEVQQSWAYRQDYPMGVLDPLVAYYYVGSIALVVLVLFVGTDGVCRDREAGTLPLVSATPVKRAHLVLAKLAAVGVAYLGAVAVSLLCVSVIAFAFGLPALTLLLVLHAVPFLALFVFLAGVGLLLGVVFRSSKAAIGTAAAVYFPVFLLGGDSPFQRLYAVYPLLGRIAEYTPFSAAYASFRVLVDGGPLPWGPLAATVGLGLGAAGAAVAIFVRQEGGL